MNYTPSSSKMHLNHFEFDIEKTKSVDIYELNNKDYQEHNAYLYAQKLIFFSKCVEIDNHIYFNIKKELDSLVSGKPTIKTIILQDCSFKRVKSSKAYENCITFSFEDFLYVCSYNFEIKKIIVDIYNDKGLASKINGVNSSQLEVLYERIIEILNNEVFKDDNINIMVQFNDYSIDILNEDYFLIKYILNVKVPTLNTSGLNQKDCNKEYSFIEIEKWNSNKRINLMTLEKIKKNIDFLCELKIIDIKLINNHLKMQK